MKHQNTQVISTQTSSYEKTQKQQSGHQDTKSAQSRLTVLTGEAGAHNKYVLFVC